MDWKELMKRLTRGTQTSELPVMDTGKNEGHEALRALDEVACVEVSKDVARELGAFDEHALSLDDVLDDEV